MQAVATMNTSSKKLRAEWPEGYGATWSLSHKTPTHVSDDRQVGTLGNPLNGQSQASKLKIARESQCLMDMHSKQGETRSQVF